MVHKVNLEKLRTGLPKIISAIDSKLDRYIVTKWERPVIVMMSVDDYAGLMETLDILSDKEAVKRIKRAEREIKQGKTISWEELKERLNKLKVK